MKVSIFLLVALLGLSAVMHAAQAQTTSDYFGFGSTNPTIDDDDDDTTTTIPIQQVTGSSIGSSEESFTQENDYGGIFVPFRGHSSLSFSSGASRATAWGAVGVAVLYVLVA